MKLPEHYTEQVYAGVLGKIIGVYLGRPFEGWTYERIFAELGEINFFVHEKLNLPLVVTDDDIAGTFTFIRAITDSGKKFDTTASDIAQAWLNYIIEKRTILWWGGLGNSTEHTAYIKLKQGIPAPISGSIKLNGRTVAEQIGSQIFIDGWSLVCPGDPERAADLARRASSVSHDGEAIYGAQVIAAMESQAFIDKKINNLIDTALMLIPRNSIIYGLIKDILEWRAAEPDWRKTREKIVLKYGYNTYGGNCHIIPNHAIILLGLLYGDDQFQKTLMITNTAGWDTDCNSGNVGCLMGIKNGLNGINNGPDWRTPIADRLYIPSADGGRAISDAVKETYYLVNIGRSLFGEEPLSPKNGARFHFELPGSLQGFTSDDSYECRDILFIENTVGNSLDGTRSLALNFHNLAPGRFGRVKTPTFIPVEAKDFTGYELIASPTLYQGQKIKARITTCNNKAPILVRLFISIYNQTDHLQRIYGTEKMMQDSDSFILEWLLGDTGGNPIAEVGIEISSSETTNGVVYLDYLTWDGVPSMRFIRPKDGGSMWHRAWVNAVDLLDTQWSDTYRLVQNEGRGLIVQGCREWSQYTFEADIKPHLLKAGGIAVNVQGLRRYYALLLHNDVTLKLLKVLEGEKVLAEIELNWEFEQSYQLCLKTDNGHLKAIVDGQVIFDVLDTDHPLLDGAVGLVCQEGRLSAEQVGIYPLHEI